ncbi:MAG: LysM peptidoglycan-binding domain-containing M23 family metallopeptidase [Rhodoplanes sp.]|uniref:LysM peptidoglycan-binding domain-containing M23 family metallopeptidase n=1 Tax=Rhodoplanes sp. TaxID=1968906 RepID=UPI00182E703D|nr:LysM peptidoglycan-binding domain-containing M23 family metallopeptidase [Rhodoplanes sp.]NVO13761.1 LysM peptidoglycan-binding domain-containing M23 family metallopeptidase [Rhodoplanes sp.]
MRTIVESSSPYCVSRVLVVLMVGLGLANCSTDSTRLTESPLQNPYSGRPSPEATGSVPGQGAPVGRVDSRPLGQTVAAQPLPPPSTYTPGSHGSVAGGGVAGGGRGLGSYQPMPAGDRTASAPEVTGSVPRLQSPAKPAASAPGWQWEGGTPVTVAPGDSLSSLSKRYGVPANVIAEANGLAGPAVLQPGRRLVIPRYAGPTAAAPAAMPPVTPVAAGPRVGSPGVHVVAPGDTLVGISKRYNVKIVDIASANSIQPHAVLKIGDRLVIPGRGGGRTALLQTPGAAPQPAPAPVAAPPVAQPAPPTRVVAAPAPVQPPAQPNTRLAQGPTEPAATASVHRTSIETPPADDDRGDRTGAGLAFRWPVKGRVITTFGKANGQQNDGINLAVPEGTQVRAAEDGVVAYAGSELKGYGNLVLVRHANGFVTAYAHNSELMVKRNDQVRRGQVIAKSGQSGTVTSPQLHFEIRKGSAPVDPMQHLPGA